MSAFVLVANTNIDQLTGKTGGDTYDTDGFVLTIDQDSRNGLEQTTSTSLGAIDIDYAKGGGVLIDGTGIWMIPYSSGTGNVPAWNTAITDGGAGGGTGKLIGVHSSLTAASTATGAAMPATGFIRVKQKSGAYTANALGGIGATADDAGRVGWIEVVGDENADVAANRLGTFTITGAWYEVGTTNGVSNQTMQIPNNGLNRYAPGVFIEQTAGGGDYEFYPNAGVATTTGTEATRGKVVWIDNTGLVRIGNSGAATNGYTPVTGLKVVIGNVILETCTTAARTANVLPPTTLNARYGFNTTGGGVINYDKVTSNWDMTTVQAYSINITNSSFSDSISFDKVATAMTMTKVGVGNRNTTAMTGAALTITKSFAGGTFTDCVFRRVAQGSSGYHTIVFTDIEGFTFTRCTFMAGTIPANATTYSILGTRMTDCTFTDTNIIQGQVNLTTCDGITMTDTTYSSAISGTTVTTYVRYVWELVGYVINSTFSGLTMPVTNTHPYTALMVFGSGCSNVKLRSIGTRAAPVTLGSVNATGYIYLITAANPCSNIKVQRVYCSNTRSGVMTSDNSSNLITEENVHGDYADLGNIVSLNHIVKGAGRNPQVPGTTASVYGTHFIDNFTSTTAGRVYFVMNEPSAETASYVAVTGGAAFTSQGAIYMPTIGMTATFTMPYYCIGHTGFVDTAIAMGLGTATNYTYRYQIDLNDGNGFSAWSAVKTSTTLPTALNGETIDASLGFKLKLEITTGTTNTTAFNYIYFQTTTTTTAQDYQYPLEVVTVKVTAKDASTLAAINGAQVYLEADSGGALPALESVTSITRTGSTASVTHTAHGMSNGMVVVIRGAAESEYNGAHGITNVTTNGYDYTVSGTPATPATGTITATARVFLGTTNASGIAQDTAYNYASDQPVIGRVRKMTASPLYKNSPITGTITSTGLDVTSFLIKDE